ncbi:hypothetical protein BX616_005885, partial [Lobosporangium transversale]
MKILLPILHLFPRDSDYEFGWANEINEGSQARRIDGFKPDGYLRKWHAKVCVVEIKCPREVSSGRKYIEDLWKIANLCKDEVDDHLHNLRGIAKMTVIQLFGHQLSVYAMEYKEGLYHWSAIGTSYLPCDRHNSGRILQCLELLESLKAYLDEICLPSTPPRDSDDVPMGKPTKISPTQRPILLR